MIIPKAWHGIPNKNTSDKYMHISTTTTKMNRVYKDEKVVVVG